MMVIKLVWNKLLKYFSYASSSVLRAQGRINQWWQNLSVTKKLYGIVGVMAMLIASELLTLMFAMSTLSAVRAFVAGEGLWTKAQKDAIHCLYQYAISGDPQQYENFKESLVINDGDHMALVELSKGREFDREVVRKGFLMGGNHPQDIDGMIELLTKFYWISYINDAIVAWSNGDRLLAELRTTAEDLHLSIQKKRPRNQAQILKKIARINSDLTNEEINFSRALGAGSRWLENLVLTVLLLLVATIEGTGIYLTYRFSHNLSTTLKNLADTALEVGKGNFTKSAPVTSEDELGQLAKALNSMAVDLQENASKRKQSEEVLRKSEERFRLLVEAVNEYAIYMLDTDGVVTTWNSGAQNIKGYSADEIIGKHFSVFYTKEAQAAHQPEIDLARARTNGRYEHENIRQRKDGSKFWASLLMTALYDNKGQLTGFSKVTRDITERKQAEQQLHKLNESLEQRFESRTRELQEREYQMRIVTNALPVSVAQVDREQKIIFINEKFARWVNCDVNSAIGRSFSEVLGDQRYQSIKSCTEKVLKGQTVSFEHFENHQSIAIETVYHMTFVPEANGSGQVTSFILVANDVTKYKEIEAELKQAKEQADVASSTKSAFLANMSHEIRTPLGAILSFSELLLGQELSSEERVRGVEVIKRNGFLLSNIINDILDLSKVEAGKLDIERIAVHFDEVVSEIKSLLNLKATEKGIRLTVTAEGAIPDVIVTDPLRLRQILLNIVGNAIKFTQKGSVDIKISLVFENSSSPKLRFLVNDTGKGINPYLASKLFEPFSQEDVSTTRKYGGTGLGLVLSKKLANSLGGDVVLLSSQPDVGSTFSITIDPGDLKKVLFQNFETKHVEAPRPSESELDFSKVNILIVDDSLDNQLIVTHLLRKTGAKIDTANNGKEGVEKALLNHYDLILMDLQMPVLDGYGAVLELKTMGYTRPIIALTAHAMKEERLRCLESGFADHISKPVDRHLLVKVIAQHTLNRGEISATL